MALSESDLQALTRGLHARAQALRGEVSGKLAQAASEGHADPGDAVDQTTAAAESAIDLAEADRDMRELRAIDAALAAIQGGTYGLCAECGVEIAAARLQAQPLALLCIECQSRDEHRRGEHHPRL